jgi:CDP-glucose 4,6-dehydratase
LDLLQPRQALDTYRGRRVLVTGHTGFKGSWLTAWLRALGADVTGLALAPPETDPDALFDRAGIAGDCRSLIGDIRDPGVVRAAVAAAEPEIVMHLAAQPLVRASYADPVGTIATNVLGTAHVLEAVRSCASVRAVVCVTTDKVYRNREWAWPYRETDELGGYDPYSASKAAAELIARSYRTALAPKDRPFALATARGGNVVGGGDWAEDRLVPDMVRALRRGEPLEIRNPDAVRPWQHVLDVCYAYLLIGAVLWRGGNGSDGESWNIGPDPGVSISVRRFVDLFFASWGSARHSVRLGTSPHFESQMLALDSSVARSQLGWRPVLGPEDTVRLTADWYRAYLAGPAQARPSMEAQRVDFESRLIPA